MKPTPDRRTRVIEAVLAIAGERGLDEVSLRTVAAEAGVSMGTVQYYCRSKDDMLLLAFEHVSRETLRRARREDRRGLPAGTVVHRAVDQFLPRGPARTRHARVSLAFAARAAVNPRLAAVHAATLAGLRSTVAAVIRTGQKCGETPSSLDPDQTAARLVALLDGLIQHVLVDPAGMPVDRARAILDEELDRVFDITRCTHPSVTGARSRTAKVIPADAAGEPTG